MAVPKRRTSKTSKKKRRTHFKLDMPTLVLNKENNEYTLPHRITKNTTTYKKHLINHLKKK